MLIAKKVCLYNLYSISLFFMEKHVLSKSTYVKGIQCQKALYLHTYHRNLKDPITKQQQAIFDQGTKVGELARNLFPNGVNCTPDTSKLNEAIIKTKQEIKKGTNVLYEAAFLFNGVLVLLDILVKDNNSYKAYEVKSSTSVTETYQLDSSIQYYVISNSGIKLEDISIIHINNQYLKNDKLNLNQLFKIESVKKEVLELQAVIPNNIKILKDVFNQKESPDVDIETYCSNPYTCEFAGHCWKDIPKYSIFNISKLSEKKKFDLYKKGILNFKDIPKDYKLSEKQWTQVQSEISGESVINKEKIKEFTDGLKFPLRFMDFETFSTAVPIYEKSKPYQQLAFQYSLHKINRNNKEEHMEYLADGDLDPRIQFIEKLIKDCGKRGDVLVYNIGFEKGRLNDLANIFPKYKLDIDRIISRLKDLMIPFQEKWYYTPEMQGSYSIKKVLPALAPEFTYDNLNIKEGMTASNTFASIVSGEYKGDKEQTRKDLLEYCKMDTLAMVKIYNKLINLD